MSPSSAWVTHCLGENGFEKALVLGKSLRRVLTTASLVVITEPGISLEWAIALESTFDMVIPLQGWKTDEFKGLLSADSLALTFGLTFTFFERCIFLNSSSLVMNNCDDLFETAEEEEGNEPCQTGRKVGTGTPIHFSPSHAAFKGLSDALRTCVVNETNFLECNEKNDRGNLFRSLDGPYISTVGVDEKQPLPDDKALVIVHLKDLPANLSKLEEESDYLENAGLLEKCIYGYWLELYKLDVKPGSFRIPKDKEPIAIVGMSCRLPDSKNLDEFWSLLIEGRDGIRSPPEDRWTKDQFPDFERVQTPAGFLNVPVDGFDAKFFGISPKEVICMDPQLRLLHELVWEGLEDAGINPAELKGTHTGVFLGSYHNEYLGIMKMAEEADDFRRWMGSSISAGTARISRLLGLTGPSIATNPACSASLASTHLAVQSLRNGECDMAIACGANLLLMPFSHETPGLDAITARDGHCKTFDASADGFGRAEGVTVFILKKLSRALKDGDRIWGLIRGTAVTQEGLSRSIGTPTVACEAKAMQLALKDGNVRPSEVSYVEAHGTGTALGDPTEINAIRQVYGNVEREKTLVIGSVKTNVGHTEACSGMTGIIKVLLSMKNEVIPRHRNLKVLNPLIELESIPAILPLEEVDWPRTPGKPRTAGVCSFGFTGLDGSAVIQEFDEESYPKQQTIFSGFERPLHLLKISAKTEEALAELLERYKLTLEGDNCPFSDIAYTANVGRASLPFRASIIAPDNGTAKDMLESGRIISTGGSGPIEMGDNVCFLFTGQGSQYHGMAKELYSTSPIFHSNFDYCENFLKSNYGISIKEVFFSEEESKDAHRTIYSQPGIFVIEYCLLQMWRSWGIRPSIVLGHSLGEFCAAVAAGILDLDDALTLVAVRSSLIETLPSGNMLVVKLDKTATDAQVEVFKKMKYGGKDISLDFAAVNTPEQTVLAGDSEIITDFKEFLKNNGGVKCSILQSTHAFHSRLMDPMLEKYRSVAKRISSKKSENGCIFISGMMGGIVNGPIVDADYWVRHTREKVNFLQASKVAWDELGCRVFLEVGPHPVLATMTMMNNNCDATTSLILPSLKRNEGNWETLLTSLGKLFVLGKADIDWNGLDQFYPRSKVGHRLPFYPFKSTKFWPKMRATRNKEIHPLLGYPIPNPTPAKLFQSKMDLNKLEYLRDHMIGDRVVFPGAGYMEMLLIAGHGAMGDLSSSLPTRPISINNFKTMAALGLEEGHELVCQTVVHQPKASEEVEGFQVEMYHEKMDGENSTWIQHATATFTTFQTSIGDEFHSYQDKEANLANAQRIRSSNEDQRFGQDLYENVGKMGLNFGQSFRTLENIWRDQERNELLAQVQTPKDSDKYLLHPSVLDATIQMALFHQHSLFDGGQSHRKLFVPTGCEKFVWFGPLKTDHYFVHVNCNGTNSNPVVILDGEGSLIAALCGINSVETSVSTIKALLETQVKSRPDFYTVEWEPRLGPLQNRVDFSVCPNPATLIQEEPTDLTDYSEAAMMKEGDRDKLIGFNAIKAFQRLGWAPKLGDRFNLEEFAIRLKIIPEQWKLVSRFLAFLEEDGILEMEGDGQWRVKTLPLDNLTDGVEKIVQNYPDDDSFLLIDSVGKNLDNILSGRTSAMQILFPISDSKPSALKMQKGFTKPVNKLDELWSKQLTLLKEKYRGNGLQLPVLRILEVGAGTGSMSESILRTLHEAAIPFEYVYTDISPSFFPAAQKRLEQFSSSMKFRKLDLEQDPSSQGFPPKYFDMVVASQVVHATRDIRETLMNIKQLMRDGSSLWLVEPLGSDRMVDSIFGLLEGFWRFTDSELRGNHPMLTMDKWEGVLSDMGFSQTDYIHDNKLGLIVSTADSGTKSNPAQLSKLNPEMQKIQKDAERAWQIFYLDEEKEFLNSLSQRFNQLERKKLLRIKLNFSGTFAKTSEMDYEINPELDSDMDSLFRSIFKEEPKCPVEGIIVTWGITSSTRRDQVGYAKPFLRLIQNMLKLSKDSLPNLILLTSGQRPIGDICCANPSPSTLIGIAQSVLNEHPELKFQAIDLEPPTSSSNLEEGVEEAFHEIFSSLDDPPSHLSAFRDNVKYLPNFLGEKRREKSLNLPFGTSRFVGKSTTGVIQDLQFQPLEKYSLGPKEIEVRVKCCSLNFQDSLDYSGVVTRIGKEVSKWKDGDAVCSFSLNSKVFPSHIQVDEDLVMEVPKKWTFAEAASIPTAFGTAYSCLVNVAKVKKGENVLIHEATDGLGLADIQVAKHLGLNIICTAGTESQRAYLRGQGIEHVFNSRRTDYVKEILRVTQGKGVDVALNSMTGAGFKEATLAVCGEGARFVEIGSGSTSIEAEVRELRPDVEFSTFNIAEVNRESILDLLESQRKWTSEGKFKPSPCTRFDAVDIRQGLRFLDKAQHIGKVVFTFPEPSKERGGPGGSPFFNDQSSYLITGGLGGIGLEVCKYMAAQGARHIVLVGRKGPTPKTANVLQAIRRESGCSITVLQGDIGVFSDCQKIFKQIETSLPPLRGVMHVAGALADGIVENQTWEKFQQTYHSKVDGSWNLHELTKSMLLEHFVLFSSCASTLGSSGQANYASACKFEDGLAHFRNSHGLPATTINWGQFGEAGMAAGASLNLVREFSLQQGINALDEILRSNRNHITPLTFNNSAHLQINSFPYTKWLFDESVLKSLGKGKSTSAAGANVSQGKFSEDYDRCKTLEEKAIVIKSILTAILRQVLHFGGDEAIDEDVDFEEMGLDSLMMIELQNSLQEVFGGRLALGQSDLNDYTNVGSMGDRLIKLMEADSDQSGVGSSSSG